MRKIYLFIFLLIMSCSQEKGNEHWKLYSSDNPNEYYTEMIFNSDEHGFILSYQQLYSDTEFLLDGNKIRYFGKEYKMLSKNNKSVMLSDGVFNYVYLIYHHEEKEVSERDSLFRLSNFIFEFKQVDDNMTANYKDQLIQDFKKFLIGEEEYRNMKFEEEIE